MIQQLHPVAARTVKQLLQRLVRHYLGEPIGDGIPLSMIAQEMLKVDRDSKLVFLSKQHSYMVDHVILVDRDNKVILDANTYLSSKWEYPHYTATLYGGKKLNLVVQEQMSITDFIEGSGLQHTFARRIERSVK